MEQMNKKDTKIRLDLWLIFNKPIKCEGEKAWEMSRQQWPNLEVISDQDSMCPQPEYIL